MSNGALKIVYSYSFEVILKDDSDLEYPQCEIRAGQHWNPVPNIFVFIFVL